MFNWYITEKFYIKDFKCDPLLCDMQVPYLVSSGSKLYLQKLIKVQLHSYHLIQGGLNIIEVLHDISSYSVFVEYNVVVNSEPRPTCNKCNLKRHSYIFR